nr:MAG TPA: hypothetical protein [Caudoviricetes sp.]
MKYCNNFGRLSKTKFNSLICYSSCSVSVLLEDVLLDELVGIFPVILLMSYGLVFLDSNVNRGLSYSIKSSISSTN